MSNDEILPNDYFRPVTTEMQSKIVECKVCSSAVFNKIEHLKWHKKINAYLRKVNKKAETSHQPWDWPPNEEESEN